MRAYGGAARDCLRAAQKEFVKAQVCGAQTGLSVELTAALMWQCVPHCRPAVLPRLLCVLPQLMSCPLTRLHSNDHPVVGRYTAGRLVQHVCSICCTHCCCKAGNIGCSASKSVRLMPPDRCMVGCVLASKHQQALNTHCMCMPPANTAGTAQAGFPL